MGIESEYSILAKCNISKPKSIKIKESNIKLYLNSKTDHLYNSTDFFNDINSHLSYEMPPCDNSPPKTSQINNYLNAYINRNNLALNSIMYKAYTKKD